LIYVKEELSRIERSGSEFAEFDKVTMIERVAGDRMLDRKNATEKFPVAFFNFYANSVSSVRFTWSSW
jgi:hypothetical protein